MKSKRIATHVAIEHHTIDMILLEQLSPLPIERYDKVNAFRDLLNRACIQKIGSIVHQGYILDVQYGQLIVTVSSLADDWKWHRVTTTEFLKELEKMGILKMESYTKFFLITINGIGDMIEKHVNQQHWEKEAEEPCQDSEMAVDTNSTSAITECHTQNEADTQKSCNVVAEPTNSGNANVAPHTLNEQPSLFPDFDEEVKKCMSNNNNKER